MKRTASCDLQGSSPTFSAAIPARAVRVMYSFAFVDTVQRRSAFRQPYAGAALRRWQPQGLSPVNPRGHKAHPGQQETLCRNRSPIGGHVVHAAQMGGGAHTLV